MHRLQSSVVARVPVCRTVLLLALLRALVCGGTAAAGTNGFRIASVERDGRFTWTNAFTAGVATIETANVVTGRWAARYNVYTSNSTATTTVAAEPGTTFVRVLAVDISTNAPDHFTNLVNSYGILNTIAGKGQFNTDKANNWLPGDEGGFATNANLSRPHIAFGDPRNDDVLIVDEGSSSVLRVTPDGRIYTFAGTHTNGFNGDGPAAATNLNLYWPNSGWMRSDGTFFILDTYNGKVRKVDTNGTMTTLFTTAPMGDGRALWVKSDESLVYFGSGINAATTLNKWTPAGGVTVVRSDFGDLGNIVGDERTGELYITDRDRYRVYRMSPDGTLITIAGNGTASGGGDGFPALQTGLNKPRTICFVPNNGGYFVGEHEGNRIWYVDAAGIIHLWMNGESTGTTAHRGDGQWFYDNPLTPKVTKVRAVTMDRHGDLIIVENNYGYVRRISFQRLIP